MFMAHSWGKFELDRLRIEQVKYEWHCMHFYKYQKKQHENG